MTNMLKEKTNKISLMPVFNKLIFSYGSNFSKDDFHLQLNKKENGVRSFRKNLVFEWKKKEIETKLLLDLPFLDYVMMRNFGEVGQNLKTAYADRLENFKGKLLKKVDFSKKESVVLIRLCTNHTIQRWAFKVNDKRLEVRND
jgi:hypothetical protein